MSVLTTLRQALRVGRMIRARGRVNPWSLNGVSSCGTSSAEANLTLLAMIVSRALNLSPSPKMQQRPVNLIYDMQEIDFANLR